MEEKRWSDTWCVLLDQLKLRAVEMKKRIFMKRLLESKMKKSWRYLWMYVCAALPAACHPMVQGCGVAPATSGAIGNCFAARIGERPADNAHGCHGRRKNRIARFCEFHEKLGCLARNYPYHRLTQKFIGFSQVVYVITLT